LGILNTLLQVLKERSIAVWQVDRVLSHVGSVLLPFFETAICLAEPPFLFSATRDDFEIVTVCLWVIAVKAVNFKYFRNIAATRTALDLDDDVERIGDVGLDGVIGELYTALQDAGREAGNALGRVSRKPERDFRTRFEAAPACREANPEK